jgi:RsiW-degrading membrane proteinase PrsW (M82 family)
MHKWYLFAFSFTGPALYLTWMYRNDKFEHEPFYFLILILGWGAFAAFLAFVMNSALDAVGLGITWLTAPIIEEFLKAVGVYWMAKHQEFNDSLDGMVYGFAAGMGFAWIENFFYIVFVYEGDLIAGLLRVFVYSFGHGVYTAFTGRALGLAKVRNGYVRPGYLLPGLALAILGHGLYNSFLIPIVNLQSLLLWISMTDGVFTLLLYHYIAQAWEQERQWFYDRGSAPTGQQQTD